MMMKQTKPPTSSFLPPTSCVKACIKPPLLSVSSFKNNRLPKQGEAERGIQISPARFIRNTNRKVVTEHRALVTATISAESSPSAPICWAMG